MSQGNSEIVLVTGASGGIGMSTALYLAERGYSVIATSRSMEHLDALRQQASARELPVTPVELDINTDEGVEAAVPRLIREHGGIDVLVNNAGYGLWGPSGVLSTKELKAQFETNFFAPLRLTRAVLPGMVARGRGTIINISSVLGRLGTPFNGGYTASKFALEGMSEVLRVELWPFGVRVALVQPGLFRTNFPTNQVTAERADSDDLPYRPYIERYRARRGRYDRLAADPIKVAKVIHKIARSRRPRFRYPVGPGARLGMASVRFLPERLFQALLSRATMR